MVALYLENGKNKAKCEESLEIFAKIIKNVIDNPNDDKFKQIRKVNFTP